MQPEPRLPRPSSNHYTEESVRILSVLWLDVESWVWGASGGGHNPNTSTFSGNLYSGIKRGSESPVGHWWCSDWRYGTILLSASVFFNFIGFPFYGTKSGVTQIRPIICDPTFRLQFDAS